MARVAVRTTGQQVLLVLGLALLLLGVFTLVASEGDARLVPARLLPPGDWVVIWAVVQILVAIFLLYTVLRDAAHRVPAAYLACATYVVWVVLSVVRPGLQPWRPLLVVLFAALALCCVAAVHPATRNVAVDHA
jgi:hypothetical protein